MTKPNNQIVQEAAEWAEELDHGNFSANQHRALATWLLKSPDHVNELLMAATIFEAWGEIDREGRISIEELLRQSAPEVVPLLGKTVMDTSRAISPWYKLRFLAAATILIGVLTIAFLASPPSDTALIYATVTGEQRSVPLEDGSIVHLNTQSQIRIRFEKGVRNIDLLEGEAMFKVAHDPARPFRVHAGDTIAEAIGTTFNIYRKGDETTVSVIEGRVAVEVLEEITLLKAGERTAVRHNGETEAQKIANMETVTSWRLRKLIFERETLQTIVREYNRYNKLQVYVDDPVLAQTRFTGIFTADDPQSLISFLEMAGDITVNRTSPNTLHLAAR